MNIFALDSDPRLSAIWQHDRHVVKMTLETTQLLCTAVHLDSNFRALWVEAAGSALAEWDSMLYKPISNPNHPIAIWTRSTMGNFVWAIEHLNALIGEYHRRFPKRHACDNLRLQFNRVACLIANVDRYFVRDGDRSIGTNPAIVMWSNQHKPFVFCGPDEFRRESVHESYRQFYLGEKIFQQHVKWTKCDSIPAILFNSPITAQQLDRLAQLVAANVEQNNPTRVVLPTVTRERVKSVPRIATPSGFRFKFSA